MTPEQTEQLAAALQLAAEANALLNKLDEGTDEFAFRAAVLETITLLAAETKRLRKEDERSDRKVLDGYARPPR